MSRRHQWTTADEAPRDELRYWRSRPIAERVSAVETLRDLLDLALLREGERRPKTHGRSRPRP